MEVYIGQGCDTGKVRKSNQDAIGVDAERGLFVVADGMGGYTGGEVASNIVVSSIREYVASSPPNFQQRINALIAGIKGANARIFQIAANDIQKKGMGTTVTALLIGGGKYFIAHIGDSRAYLIREGKITRITRDHSFVQGLVNSGILTPEEARTHERRNEITRAVGVTPEIEIDTYEGEFRESDAVLLCSDGLWGELSEEEILNIVTDSENPQVACNSLIDSANNKGGNDNISVIIVQPMPRIKKVMPGRQRLKLPYLRDPTLIKRGGIVVGVVGLITILILVSIQLVTPRPKKEVWVRLLTEPETLRVKRPKLGKDTLIISGESLLVQVGESLVFNREGFYDTIFTVAPKDKEYKIELHQMLVPVSFVCYPDDAEITVLNSKGDIIKKVTSESLLYLPFGQYTFLFKHSQYEPLKKELTITEAHPISITAELKSRAEAPTKLPPPKPPVIKEYWIGIIGFTRNGNFNPQICGASIYIDGELRGTVPSTKNPKRIRFSSGGQYRIELRKNGILIGEATVDFDKDADGDVTLFAEDFK